MTEILAEVIAQWGLAGLAAVAAGYVIWNNHKDAKEAKQKYEDLYNEKIAHMEDKYKEKGRASESMKEAKQAIEDLGEKIDNISYAQEGCHNILVDMGGRIDGLNERVNSLDKAVNGNNNTDGSEHLMKMAAVAPTIHTLVQNNMDEMKADHVFIALLHNGTKGLTGIPFMKMKVVIEKYNPLDNLNDIEYASRFAGEDIMTHDKLPIAILQNDLVDITVNDDGTSMMDQLDMISAREMRKIGTKRIIFRAIRDIHGTAMGYVVAYSYKTKDMDVELFKEMVHTIERMYRDVCS